MFYSCLLTKNQQISQKILILILIKIINLNQLASLKVTAYSSQLHDSLIKLLYND